MAETKNTVKKPSTKKKVETNPLLILGSRMDMIRRVIPDGNLVLKYISELEKKFTADEIIGIGTKVVKTGKKK